MYSSHSQAANAPQVGHPWLRVLHKTTINLLSASNVVIEWCSQFQPGQQQHTAINSGILKGKEYNMPPNRDHGHSIVQTGRKRVLKGQSLKVANAYIVEFSWNEI